MEDAMYSPSKDRFIEEIVCAVIMHMDGASMTAQQGIDLAERLNGEIEGATEDRRWQDNVIDDTPKEED